MGIISAGKIIEGARVRREQAVVKIEDLAADADIAARAEFCAPAVGAELVKIGVIAQGSAAGVDNANTAVIVISDAAGNTIVSRTYNTGTPFPAASVYDDLGALDSTHRILTANEVVRIAVTQGTTANLPAFLVLFEYEVAQV
jgi:hypothetical protein